MGLLDELLKAQKPKRNLMGTQMVRGPDQPYLRQDYPTVYGALGGLLGTAPDEMAGSVLDPNTAAVRQGAEYGFPVGTALGMLPAAGLTKGLPVGMGIKPINLEKGIYRPELTMEEMLKVKDIPTVERVRKSMELVGEKEFENMVNAQFKKYKPTNQDTEAMLVESVTLNILGKAQRAPYPQQAALDLAQQRAALPVSQGGLGLPAGNTAEQRAAAMGFNTDAYHGTTTNIKPTFNLDYSGSNAVDYGQKNIFASSDPQLASDYALKGLSRNQAEAIMQKKDYDWYKSKVIPKDILDAFVKDAVEYGVAEGGGANVLPLLMRGNIFPYEAYGGRFSSEIPKALFGRDLSNADIAAINNVVDNPTFKKINPSTVYAIKNPENIRSRFAAFDPFRRSAAIAATMGVAAPDLLASPIDEEELRRRQSGLLYAP
jgi:hypothetical protein